ncbi:MAG: hypothetical protein U9R50_12175 [Campylobacterota bacterium]|nr:hypothetical protein [Campylobacterota bacterium]
MKFLIILFLTCKVLLADDYTIQLMSYKHESSLTPYFMKIVKATALEPRIFSEGGYKKITIGSFKTRSEAIRISKTLKCLPLDIFVRKYQLKAIAKEIDVAEIQKSKEMDYFTQVSCNASQTYKMRRSYEIKEALDYFRNSAYYRFSAPHKRGLSKQSR